MTPPPQRCGNLPLNTRNKKDASMDNELKAALFAAADRCLLDGEAPTPERMQAALGAHDTPLQAIERGLKAWWQALPVRVRLDAGDTYIPDMPEVMKQTFSRIWHQAVQEAHTELSLQLQRPDPSLDQAQRECDDALRRSQGEVGELEARQREQAYKLEQAREQVQALEAEIQVLRQNLSSETMLRKKEEQLRSNADQELAHLRKAHEDAKRVFDQRIRDEQRHGMEALAKVEVDTRHYRNVLEKLRDESGRREGELTREIHELQGLLARREVKVETQATQIKSQTEELRKLQAQEAQQQRDFAQLNAQLLTESNRSKRLEERVQQLEEELQRLNQKLVVLNSESGRREHQLRGQLKEKEELLLQAQGRAKTWEKRVAGLEEENRRLKNRV
jgi:septal ring factor EnvC (AmiA/AmiB activator)